MIKTLVLLAASLSWAEGFDVATVKPNRLNDRIVTVQVSAAGTFMARGYTLELLIQRAYAVRYGYVSGGPGWVYADRFDIAAKASVPGKFTEAQLRPMLAKLLADRFRLRVHNETKDVPGYSLEVGRGGAKFTRSAGTEQSDTARMTSERFTAQGIGMADFARFLGNKLGVPMADETGLTGTYDIDVRWEVQVGPSSESPGNETADALRAAVFHAIEQQLGLKVRSKKVAVSRVIIDHAEKPAAADH